MTTDHAPGPVAFRLPDGLDPLAELVALADEASAILEAFSPEFISSRERAAWERRRATILATLADQQPAFTTSARRAASDWHAAEQVDLTDTLTRVRQGEPINPGPELARSRTRNSGQPTA